MASSKKAGSKKKATKVKPQVADRAKQVVIDAQDANNVAQLKQAVVMLARTVTQLEKRLDRAEGRRRRGTV